MNIENGKIINECMGRDSEEKKDSIVIDAV
jgi:hypothetical protein